MIRLTFGILLFLFDSTVAWADWEWTRWGMSPEQVVRASKGRATVLDPAAGKRLNRFEGTQILAVMSEYQAAGKVFEVRFGFDAERRLNEVTLNAGADAFYDLVRMMTAIYGAPVDGSDRIIPGRTWIDRSKGNAIQLIKLNGAVIQYRPVPKGL